MAMNYPVPPYPLVLRITRPLQWESGPDRFGTPSCDSSDPTCRGRSKALCCFFFFFFFFVFFFNTTI